MDLRTLPPLTKLVDEGIEKDIALEFETWNTRNNIERYPLSPSGIGKCALKLARDLAHYHGIGDYPRSLANRSAKLQRVFSRGHLLEGALVEDIQRYTHLKLKQRQQRVHLFDVTWGQGANPIEGDVDGLVVCSRNKAKILIDFKSKGAYYSAGFNDSISQFFESLRETGQVEDLGHNCYFVKDVYELFKIIPLDNFFVDYLHQLNSYAFSDWFSRIKVDGVALYYENKNTCQNYEVRWVPSRALFEYAKEKYQYIYSTVMESGAESIQREFPRGSSRCRLCEYNLLCNPPKDVKNVPRQVGSLDPSTEAAFKKGIIESKHAKKVEEEILIMMERKSLTHITLSDGMTYERKYLKSPKEHYELRLCK